ncbi:MAG: ABC transporter ATP-binding protein [Gammaproteobacteria bacterium]|nr:ABC transporter ATP-binding protein [Gammaproteobacteria bacterium]MDH4254393.1 ABC transporter ATP-binding protein [Gammaproteobacteria bacterium]MDH5309326.1 ABC transporter ATP-binding protein [Gammaproteobacteria bacterium]
MPADRHALLTASRLDIDVPGRRLVEGLDLDVTGGQFIAILGRNGTGKSLSLHTLAGLRPATGAIRLDGETLATMPRRLVARRLALLPQYSEDVFPASVFDTVLIGRHPHIGALRLESADDRSIAMRCLEAVDLGELADRDVGTLSGGERRRLSIAQVLSQEPALFLLDEPTNHLDPQHQLDVLDLFAAKARDGAAVIASLHDVNLAARYAGHCLLLHGDGRWEFGRSDEILTEERLSELYRVGIESTSWRGRPLFVAADRR